MFSPLQLLIDREVESMIQRFQQGVTVDPDEIALDTIREIGSGIGRSYLESEHTLTHYRNSLWFPKLLDRHVWRDDLSESVPDTDLLQRAEAQFNEIVARYAKPEVDEDKLERVRQVVRRARKELLGAGA
jgi:trimethylamine--corrinoid protein Co-methyltransferase